MRHPRPARSLVATLAIVLVVAIIMLMRFRSRRFNRHPMEGERERNIGEAIDKDMPPPH